MGSDSVSLQVTEPTPLSNIAPSQKVLAIRFNPETQARSLDALQWGLIPYWTKDPKISYRTINGRVETVDKAPSYREAFKRRRCLIPADGFYEWRKTAKPKLPFALRHERRTPVHLCRTLGKLERSRIWGVAAHLHDYHRRAQRARRTGPSPYAGDSSGKTSRRMARENRERELKRVTGPLSCRPDANVGAA